MERSTIVQIVGRQIQGFDKFLEFWRSHPDGNYEIKTKDTRKRSTKANGYYRGVVLPIFRAALYDAGWHQITSDDIAHEFALEQFSKITITNFETGETVYITERSHEKNNEVFWHYVETIRMWSSEFLGVYIPDPNEPVEALEVLSNYLSWKHANQASR